MQVLNYLSGLKKIKLMTMTKSGQYFGEVGSDDLVARKRSESSSDQHQHPQNSAISVLDIHLDYTLPENFCPNPYIVSHEYYSEWYHKYGAPPGCTTIQLIYQDFSSPFDVLNTFDLDYVRCAFHKGHIYRAPDCIISHLNQESRRCYQIPHSHRLIKCVNKGFKVPVLGNQKYVTKLIVSDPLSQLNLVPMCVSKNMLPKPMNLQDLQILKIKESYQSPWKRVVENKYYSRAYPDPRTESMFRHPSETRYYLKPYETPKSDIEIAKIGNYTITMLKACYLFEGFELDAKFLTVEINVQSVDPSSQMAIIDPIVLNDKFVINSVLFIKKYDTFKLGRHIVQVSFLLVRCLGGGKGGGKG